MNNMILLLIPIEDLAVLQAFAKSQELSDSEQVEFFNSGKYKQEKEQLVKKFEQSYEQSQKDFADFIQSYRKSILEEE